MNVKRMLQCFVDYYLACVDREELTKMALGLVATRKLEFSRWCA